MNIRRSFIILVAMLFGTGILRAQDVTVTVTPTQSILPPQLMLYITEPANYFNISLSNTGKDNANVYLVMQVEQVNPSSGLSLSTPPNRQPKVPIVIPAGGTHILSPAEVRGLFNHIPLNEIKAPQGLFDNYTNGSFGLLPEGQYEMHFTAYRWDPSLADPVVISSPTGGAAYFSVCYKAQAPEFLTPMAADPNALVSVAELDPLSPQFTWKAPVVACNPNVLQYTYSMRIVEVLPNQAPDNSMDHNPVVYQTSNLTTPLCMIPSTVIKQMKEGTTYAAQVTATSANANNRMLNYVSIANEGKSTYKLFRLKPSSTPNIGNTPKNNGGDNNDLKKDTDDENGDIYLSFGNLKGAASITDSLYNFSNPNLLTPFFRSDAGARKVFETADIAVSWQRPEYENGEGMRSDTVKIEYDVELYDNGSKADREEALKKEPVYTFHTKDLKDTIKWEKIKDKVKIGDYLLLRVKPSVKKGESVSFSGDANVIDFGLCERLSQRYFQCEAKVVIDDKNPTSKSANDLKGKTVAIGEYNMTIDDIKGSGSEGFTGTGRVEWEPFGFSVMVCVKFENLMINKDDVVYDGVAESVPAPEMKSSAAVVDNLFSEWGIDNLIGDSGLPYANQLQGEVTGRAKSLAEKISLGEYYQKVQDGKSVLNFVTTGKIDKLYMPVKFPTEVLPGGFDAVDLQIAGMKFAANYATMNIIGEATMPECDILKSKLLVFGAPRVCISPNSFLPEDGHIALLGDFTLTPSSDVELTFKAPKNPITPTDGCYLSWKTSGDGKTKLELLGIDADLKIDGLVKDINGKATKERPVMNLQASVGSWDDFLVDNISIEDFQFESLPGWTFQASDVVYDHSDTRNSDHMGAFPEKYDKKLGGCEKADEMWHGLHIGKVGVAFPSSLELTKGDEKSDSRLWIGAEELYWDQSGVTVKMGAANIFKGKEGTLGGWGISLDKAQVEIIQNDFDNCMFAGQLNVPILKPADKEKMKGRFGNVDYTCQIRRLTNPKPDKQGNIERQRFAYIFLTEQVDDLDFGFLVGNVHLEKDQTYFLVEAYDNEKEGEKPITQIELCMGGRISIGVVDKANEKLQSANKRMEELNKDIPLKLKIPEMHFTKMRFSNVSRSTEWKSVDKHVEEVRQKRIDAEKKVHDDALLIVLQSHELNIGTPQEPFYFDFGEWSLSSPEKYVGPFKFNLDKFEPGYDSSAKKVTLTLGGSLGLLEDKINVGAEITISAAVNIGKMDDIDTWSISDGKVDFKELKLKLDFTALSLDGTLKMTTSPDKGYGGSLKIEIKGFFGLDCEGGYYEHEKDPDDKNDSNFSWGYFKASIKSSAGIHIDPVVINRIAGGFYFNCRPTAGEGKFDGTPKPKNGCIGIAFGLGLSTTAGEQALSADLDMLVVFDSKNNCFSTFMLNGKLEALGGMVKADCSLIYENEMNNAGESINRYLILNITLEAGVDTKAIVEKVKSANASLAALKDKMDDFQKELDPSTIFKKPDDDPKAGLGELAGGTGEATEGEDQEKKEKELGITAGKLEISLEFKVTWAQGGKTFDKPKWHLYIGQPAKDKRCRFTLLKFDSSICSVDIGADGYLCLGNELPDNGALPPIPSKITEFLSGHKNSDTNMGADLGKAERSRKAAVQALLEGADCKGGVMVGASAWGMIKVDLGLIYGSLDAIAGFDIALVNYGNNAYCVNSGSEMGKNGWYGMGQLYAYLAADLGLHIHIGDLINKKITLLYAGIGGMLEMGMPNPTWVEGAVRVKVNLLGGLFKLNKKFDFSAGDHCVPYMGNALDGFEMFQGVSHGSDSIVQALMEPSYAISLAEAKNMTFTTNASIGSHYRLVDPSYSADMVKELGEQKEKLELNASRTYVFDINQDKNQNKMKMGVRLFDLGDGPTLIWDEYNAKGYKSENIYSKELDLEYCLEGRNGHGPSDKKVTKLMREVSSTFVRKPRSMTVDETSIRMQGRNLQSERYSTRPSDYLINNNDSRNYAAIGAMLGEYGAVTGDMNEVNCSFREDKGTTFHLTDMDLKPGHCYMLVLSADAYEIENARRVWCNYFSEKLRKEVPIHWQQKKAWFFRIKGEKETTIVVDSIRDLEPYIALAYPSTNGTRVNDTRGEGVVTAYIDDIMHPTIALREDLSQYYNASKMKWVLEAYTAAGDTLKPQTRNAQFVKKGNCVNLEPTSAFTRFTEFQSAINKVNNKAANYNFENERYRLKLYYTYSHKRKERELKPKYNDKGEYIEKVMTDVYYDEGDSTVTLVDLQLCAAPHDVRVASMSKLQDDNWMQTTSNDKTGGKLLSYVEPFVGATVWDEPVVDYTLNYPNLDDEFLVFRNSKYQGKSYRTIDPYLYFAYLGKWVFIGDKKIDAYAFDDAYIPFASESLIFSYNGAVVNSEFMWDQSSKTLLEVRDQMYGLWNDWNYNNKNMPRYPLPSLTTTVGGITANNQDGKCSTVTPMNLNYSKDMTFSFEDIVEDYTAPYYLAKKLSSKLYWESSDLRGRFYYHWSNKQENSSYDFDKEFNADILRYSQLHRGQYIEYTYRGFNVKVPYYQLPLLFGNCFGVDRNGYKAMFASSQLSDYHRNFGYSAGTPPIASGLRYHSESSNLFFRRLCGTEGSWYGYNDQVFTKYKNTSYSGSYSEKDMPGYSSLSPHAQTMAVKQDKFDMDAGLKAVSDFHVRIYRVDSYDITSGLYTVSNMGGGPWEQDKSINAQNKTASNLYTMNTELNKKAEYERTHYDSPRPQAICTLTKGKSWGDNDYTLTFVYSDSIYAMYDENSGKEYTFNGMEYMQVWAGDDILEKHPWSSYRSKYSKVVFDKSFAKCEVKSTRNWFELFKKLTSVQGTSNLNTSKVTDMHGMFWRCESLTSLDLTSWNTENVTDMSCMFYVCSKLKNLYINNFKTEKVTKMNEMFRSCESLQPAKFDNFTSESLTTTEKMFYNCAALREVSLKGMEGSELKNCSGMFGKCKSLKILYINSFCPNEKVGCDVMFEDVPSSLYSQISYDLIDKIKNQIPGSQWQCYNDNYKVVYGTISNSEYVLLFLNDATDYKKNKSYDITIKGTEIAKNVKRTVTVKDFWTGEDVMNTQGSTNSVPWNKYASNVKTVYIDERFKQSPSNTAYWFGGFKNLERIYGLTNLNVERAVNMIGMFWNCEKLQELNTSKLKTKSATQMNYMFEGCKNLKKLDLSSFYTMNVTKMVSMFKDCQELTEIKCPLYFPNDYEESGGFVTDNVTNMSNMFYNCYKLKKIYDSFYSTEYFHTEKVTDMSNMFYNCRSFEELPVSLSSFDNVTNMRLMCYGCSSLKRFSEYSKFEKVTKLDNMLASCTSMEEVNLPYIKPKSLSSALNMFDNVPKNCTIYLPYDTNKKILDECKNPPYTNRILIVPAYAMLYQVADKYEMRFFGTETALKEGDTWSGYKIKQLWTGRSVMDVQDIPWWASNIYPVTKITIESSFKNVPLINMNYYFGNMPELTSISGLQNLNTAAVKDMSYMFWGDKKLTSLSGIENWNTSSATSMKQMFASCKELTSLNVSKWNTANVTDMSSMFSGCSSLQTLNIKGLNTTKVEDMMMMFYGCKSLTSLDLSTINTATADAHKSGSEYFGLGAMFTGCSSLKKLDVSKFIVTHQNNLYYMFQNCSSLEELDLINWDTEGLKKLYGTFNGCTSLRKLVLGAKFNAKNLKKDSWVDEFTDVHDLVVITPSDKLSEIKTSFTNLGFKVGTTGDFYDKMPDREPQIVWTEADKTLTFYYGVPVGSTFNGMKVTQVWKGTDVTNTPYSNSKAPWISTVSGKLTTVVFDASFVNVKPTKTNGWFADCKNITAFKGLDNLNTSSVTSMANMFANCSSVTELDVSKFNTSNVTNMYGMFQNMKKVTALDVSKWNTAKVTDVGSMFYYCMLLKELDLTNWDMRAVTRATYFLYNPSNNTLKKIKAGANFSLPKMSSKASYCFNGLSDVEVQVASSNLSTVRTAFIDKMGFVEGTHGYIIDPNKKVAQAIWLGPKKRLVFYYGREYKAGETFKKKTITKVWKGTDVTATYTDSKNQAPWTSTVSSTCTEVEFDESFKDVKPSRGYSWFYNMSALTALTGLKNLNTSSMNTMSRMFYNCSKLTSLDLSTFNTANVTNMYYMFYNCSKLKSVDLSSFDTGKVTTMGGMFRGCTVLSSLNITKFNTVKVENFAEMFYECAGLTTLDVSKLNTGAAKLMNHMFYGCTKVKDLDVLKFSTYNVTNMKSMFYGCAAITGLSVYNWNVQNVTNMSYMFYGCSKLDCLNAEKWNTAKVTDMSYMFYNCPLLRWVRSDKWKTSNVTTMAYMFKDCAKLSDLRVGDFDVSKVTTMQSMFSGCSTLDRFYVGKWNIKSLSNISYMFNKCTKLKYLEFGKNFNNTKLSGSFVFGDVKGATVYISTTSGGTSTTIQPTLRATLKKMGWSKSNGEGYHWTINQ
ncbi:MAG: BspA family leucine-rich repeat surface protein [Bacteroidaceae bacterium]|nr:BspA family leucine-rich repeat surface protein [Bacteroidaceae bacterium]